MRVQSLRVDAPSSDFLLPRFVFELLKFFDFDSRTLYSRRRGFEAVGLYSRQSAAAHRI